jgi:hypothetical protein
MTKRGNEGVDVIDDMTIIDSNASRKTLTGYKIMAKFAIIEIGNGPWCDPIEAKSIDAALEVVKSDLRDSNPVDYVDEYEVGDDLPKVKVTIRDIDTDEEIKRTLTVGQ